MTAGRCPRLVGRRDQLDALRAGLEGARRGRGGISVLTGPAGIGKSRLAREVVDEAALRDVPVVVGRAVEAGRNDAFRPIGEALLAGLRRQPEPDDPALAPFRPVLGRLVPRWRHPGSPPYDDAVVLHEAVLRLLAALAGERGLLVVLEDLHWADPETLAVVEYLADNLAEERVAVVATTRDEPCPALRVLHHLVERQAARTSPLLPLGDDEVDEMAAACLGAPAGDALPEVLRQRSGGNPLLIEELLAAGTDPATRYPPP